MLLLAFGSVCTAQVFPVNTVVQNGPDTNRINLVTLADGFMAAELPTFVTATQSISSYVFTVPPFQQYRNFFNVYAISVPSVQSGASHPGTATDVPEPTFPVSVVNNYFNSTFDVGGTHRAIVALNSAAAYSVLNDNFPMYDIPIVIANTPNYGGTGGAIGTITLHTAVDEVMVHELGHTFGLLWDEYWNGYGIERANMTQDSDPNFIIWKNWLNTNGIGIYPYGATSPQADWYRPHQDCKMQSLGEPFCSVCKEGLIDQIYNTVRPIDAVFPDTAITLTATTTPLPFSFVPIKPIPNTLTYRWLLNNTPIPGDDTSLQLTSAQLAPGTNTLTAVIVDTTNMSRSYLPGTGYMFSLQWSINKSATSVNTVYSGDGKFFYRAYPVPAMGTVNIAYKNQTTATMLRYALTAINGAVVKQGEAALQRGDHHFPIDISALAAGTYQCTLQSDGIYATTPIIVQ